MTLTRRSYVESLQYFVTQHTMGRLAEEELRMHITALMGEPESLDIRWVDTQAVTLKPGDTIVLSYSKPLSLDAYCRVTAHAEKCFPGHRVVVLDDGLRLGVLSPEAPA